MEVYNVTYEIFLPKNELEADQTLGLTAVYWEFGWVEG